MDNKKLKCVILLMIGGMILQTYGQEKTCSTCFNTIFSSLTIYANVPVNIVNGIQIAKGTQNRFFPITGLFTGATEIALGIQGLPKWKIDDTLLGRNRSDYNSEKAFAIFNIGFGAATMGLATRNLIANKKSKPEKTSWNLYSFPASSKSAGFAFSFSRAF